MSNCHVLLENLYKKDQLRFEFCLTAGLKYKRPEDYGGVHNEASWPDQQNHDRTVDLRYISYWDINEPDQGDGSTACGVAQKDKGLALKTCTRFRPFFCKYEACLQGKNKFTFRRRDIGIYGGIFRTYICFIFENKIPCERIKIS